MTQHLGAEQPGDADTSQSAMWAAYEAVAPGWDPVLSSMVSGVFRPGVGGLWVVPSCTERYRLRLDRLTVILHEVIPVHVTPAGDRICGRLYAVEPLPGGGSRLRLELLLGSTGREGEGRVVVPRLGPIEQPFDANGVVQLDVPVSQLGALPPLRTTCRRWPSHLRRLTVVVPEQQAKAA